VLAAAMAPPVIGAKESSLVANDVILSAIYMIYTVEILVNSLLAAELFVEMKCCIV
jgi:hypothetical protein